MPAIKENLKSLRTISGLSQNEVAEALNVTRQTISSYETGRTEPDWEMLKKLAELYNVDVHDVLYGGNEQQRKIKRIRMALYIISGIFLLCLLLQSAFFMINNTYFPVEDRMVSFRGIEYIEERLLLRNIGDRISIIGILLFKIGYLVLIYPMITIRSTYSQKKLTAFTIMLILAMMVVPLPFMLLDKISGFGDYYFAVIQVFPILILFYLILFITKITEKAKLKRKT